MSEETLECPNEECSHPIKESDLVDLEDGETFVCPNCGEIEFTKSGDEIEYQWVNGEPMAEPDEDDEYEEEEADEDEEDEEETEEVEEVEKETKPRRKPTGKRMVVKHKKRSHEYIDFFLDRPEGVTIDMLAEAFGLNIQAAHYAQRRTFKDAENAGYEVEKKRVPHEMQKLFFIRDKV